MQFDIGTVHTGKISGIAAYGAFVTLPEGKVGMVHISEISDGFVKNISDYLKVGDDVLVKILSLDEKGKYALSIRRAANEGNDAGNKIGTQSNGRAQSNGRPGYVNNGGRNFAPRERAASPSEIRQTPAEYTAYKNSGATFEDMMTKFKRDSDEKINDIKKGIDSKRGTGSARGPRQKKK